LKANGFTIDKKTGGLKDDRRKHHKQTEPVFFVAILKTICRMVATAYTHSSFGSNSNSICPYIAAKSVAQ
jgi:hypothetical protein